MKSQLASIELRSLVEELQCLVGGKIDNIYHPKKDDLTLILHIPSHGKKYLRFFNGKFLYLSSIKPIGIHPSEFCLTARKHLSNARIQKIQQLESERIVAITLEKEERKKLIFELFAKGNILLLNNADQILVATTYKKFKDRDLLPKKVYVYPKMPVDIFRVTSARFSDVLKQSKKSLIKALATEIGVGGVYAEEICLLSKTDKNTPASSLSKEKSDNLHHTLQKIVKCKTKAQWVLDKKEVTDITPFPLKTYGQYMAKKFPSLNAALDQFFLTEYQEEIPKSAKEQELARLQRIIASQEEKIEQLKTKETEEKKKAELIFTNYQELDKMLKTLLQVQQEKGWATIQTKLKNHSKIKDVNAREKTISVEL